MIQDSRKVTERYRKKLTKLYAKSNPTVAMNSAIANMRTEYMRKKAELTEEYMQKEVDILKDKSLQLQI